MISITRFISVFINNNNDNCFRVYSKNDKEFNDNNNIIGYEREKHISLERLHGYLDYSITKDNKVIKFIETKIRSKTILEFETILQVCFYEYVSGCDNWKIVIYNRKQNYLPVEYDKQYVVENYKKKWEKAKKVVNFIWNNQKKIDKALNFVKKLEKDI